MKQLKRFAGIAVLVITAAAFFYYLRGHPDLVGGLRHIRTTTLLAIIALYGATLGVLVLIYDTTLKLCKQSIPLKEHVLLTMYSSIANFFGPLQSGPGVRLVYLKQRHGVRLRNYAMATFAYYILFGVLSGLFLLTGVRQWREVLGLLSVVILVAGGLMIATKKTRQVFRIREQYSVKLIGRLAVLTLLQVLLVAVIYFTELRAIDDRINFSQAIIYTGAANFALFVSLTPGALGFRESFLFFSQKLHHIDGSTIIAANVVDRAVYVVFLGILLVVIMAVHGKDRLGIKQQSLK